MLSCIRRSSAAERWPISTLWVASPMAWWKSMSNRRDAWSRPRQVLVHRVESLIQAGQTSACARRGPFGGLPLKHAAEFEQVFAKSGARPSCPARGRRRSIETVGIGATVLVDLHHALTLKPRLPRSEGRDTPSSTASSRSGGRRSPGLSEPSRMRRSSEAATASEIRGT